MLNKDKETPNIYNKHVPRYTSYPIHPKWNNEIDSTIWIKQLSESLKENNEIELYVHIPYCEQLCFYCGCNRTITKNHSKDREYIDTVLREWKIYTDKFPDIRIRGLHFGGGTPTFFSPENLDYLLSSLKDRFVKDEFHGAIELDPRVTTDEHLKVFQYYGLSKASLGIQDFNHEVQVAINRVQPVDMVSRLTKKLRAHGFKSINFDLIYGLPKQDQSTICETLKQVLKISPDTISLFSYSHIPEKIKNQKVLNKYELMDEETKIETFDMARGILQENGYGSIGMDHFSKINNPLYIAFTRRKLKRTFMGYVPDISKVTIGLGATSISDSGHGFIQNEKSAEEYKRIVALNKLPITYGHTHSHLDVSLQTSIQEIMCYGATNLHEVILTYSKDFSSSVVSKLNYLHEKKLISFKNAELEVLPAGFPYLRNICHVLDYTLN